MKGPSVTQIDISGAWESACDCKTTLHCLCINTHPHPPPCFSRNTHWQSKTHIYAHTQGSFLITSRDQREKVGAGIEKREESRSKVEVFAGLVTGCDRLGCGPSLRGFTLGGVGAGWVGGDCVDSLLKVTGHLASLLFFFFQAEITPRVSLVPVTVKSPGAPNDFSSLL